MGEDIIGVTKTAELLEISKASVRNWVKHGYLTPVEQGKHFRRREVLQLKEDISEGKIDRLNKRANKVGAVKYFVPTEYIETETNRRSISHLIAFIMQHDIDRKMAILLLAINQFIVSGDIRSSDLQRILTFSEEIFCRNCVRLELKEFFEDLGDHAAGEQSADHQVMGYIIHYLLPSESDILGIVYQSLLLEGNKATLGSYFTPFEIVHSIIRDHIQPDYQVLDPCCGTGQFLLSFAAFLQDPDRVTGKDIDPIAVHIARINLLLAFSHEFEPKVFQADTLAIAPETEEGEYDFIATNPPWGAVINKKIKEKLKVQFPQITSGESFSYFLRTSIPMLKAEGVLSFVLPEAILNVRAHSDIRNYILENCHIQKIEPLGNRFKRVLSQVIRMDLVKKKPSGKEKILIAGRKQYQISQNRFIHNKWNVFDIYLNDDDEKIISKIYKVRHCTLEGHADWALGIVTGDNHKYLRVRPEDDCEPIYRGSDVYRFTLKKPETYIQFTPENFQQVASEQKYRAREKLIYRFISNRLVFAYDDQGYLTLNSANILIPKIDYPIKVILALFNSSLFDFIFKKKFHALKILRGDLEQLPLPLWEKKIFNEIESLVDQIIKGKAEYMQLDDYLMDQFQMDPKERAYVRTCTQTLIR